MSDLYNIIEGGRDADSKDIKRAYYDLAKVNHPDKGGDPEKFKEIKNAYDVLSDSGKRQMYDMTGNTNPNDSPQQGGMHFGGMPGMPIAMHVGMHGMPDMPGMHGIDRKSTRLNSSHRCSSYAVFCLKKKRTTHSITRRYICARKSDESTVWLGHA